MDLCRHCTYQTVLEILGQLEPMGDISGDIITGIHEYWLLQCQENWYSHCAYTVSIAIAIAIIAILNSSMVFSSLHLFLFLFLGGFICFVIFALAICMYAHLLLGHKKREFWKSVVPISDSHGLRMCVCGEHTVQIRTIMTSRWMYFHVLIVHAVGTVEAMSCTISHHNDSNVIIWICARWHAYLACGDCDHC